MTQTEINLSLVELLRGTIKELRRSTRSHDWDDMPGLVRAVDDLEKHLRVQQMAESR
jgi:hypothetical protein